MAVSREEINASGWQVCEVGESLAKDWPLGRPGRASSEASAWPAMECRLGLSFQGLVNKCLLPPGCVPGVCR